MEPATFLTELKRRKVYRVAVAYAIVAWLLIQAASILFPTFEAPPWVMKVFVSAVILGFPVALILAWAFELTPEGIRRSEEYRRGSRSRQKSVADGPRSLSPPPCSQLHCLRFNLREQEDRRLPNCQNKPRQLQHWTNRLLCCHSKISARTRKTRFSRREFRMKSSPRSRESVGFA